jgi:hypothetical protein
MQWIHSCPERDPNPRASPAAVRHSFCVADAERSIYVENFAMANGHHFHHARVTLDGVHAIDVTLRPEEGSIFRNRLLVAHIEKADSTVRNGELPMQDPLEPTETLETLVETGAVSSLYAGGTVNNPSALF